MIIDRISTDLKNAMLSGDKSLTGVLRDLKSALLYEQVSQGNKGDQPSDELVNKVFSKELKKRKDAIAIYEKAGEAERVNKEKYESEIISKYLPEPVSNEDIAVAISKYASDNDVDLTNPKSMGQLIGGIKQSLGGNVDGSELARLVKEFISENK